MHLTLAATAPTRLRLAELMLDVSKELEDGRDMNRAQTNKIDGSFAFAVTDDFDDGPAKLQLAPRQLLEALTLIVDDPCPKNLERGRHLLWVLGT